MYLSVFMWNDLEKAVNLKMIIFFFCQGNIHLSELIV